MAVTTTNLGVITAYGDAVAAGYTGTKAEWQALMASYATVGQQAVDAKNDAVAAKNTAVSKATEATTAASTATTKANEASASAQSIAQSAAQIQENTDDIDQLKSEFADMESDGAVPSAEQILTDNGITDSVPYHYRKTGGDGADRLYDQIVGGTVNWNQLASFTSSEIPSASSGISYAYTDGTSVKITGTATAFEQRTGWFGLSELKGLSLSRLGHIVLVDTRIISGSFDGNINYGIGSSALRPVGTPYIGPLTNSNTDQIRFQHIITEGTVCNDLVVSINVFDLTAMFGSTIADYIYQLEQATAGAGLAFFKALFPNDYYPYNAGELISVSGLSAHVMRDVDDNIIRTYPLDSTLTLRGLFKLDANNKLYADGDTYDADGTVTRKYGIVDLGTLNWSYNSGNNRFDSYFSDASLTPQTAIVANAIASKYITVSFSKLYADTTLDKCLAFDKNNLRIRDMSYTDAAAFKAAMSGVMLVYELATPTTEEADPYQHLQQCDPNGTEEYVSTGIVPVGHNSFYPENLRAKVEQLPWNFANLIAPTESTFTATRNYTTGALFIVDNVLYKATSNIANGGTITPNTNCTATTLAEIISALA